jgi:hypothetical protein
MAPLRLTGDQLAQIMQTASALPQDQRDQFLQIIAGLLAPEPGDGQVFRACTAAARAVRYDSLQCEAV